MSVKGGKSMAGEPSGSKGKSKTLTHPTYAHLIHDAIGSLKQRGGSSAVAIRKTIEEKMGPSLGPNYKKIVGSTLSKLAKTGKLIKTGNTFKLSPQFKQENLRHRRRHRRRRRRRRKGRKKGKRRRRRRHRRSRSRKGRKHRRRRKGRRRRRRRRRRRSRRGRRQRSKSRSKSPRHHRRRRRRHRRRRSRGRKRAEGPTKRVRHASHVHIHQANSENSSIGDRSL